MRVLVVGAPWPPETFLQRLFGALVKRGLVVGILGAPQDELARSLGIVPRSRLPEPAALRREWDLVYFPWNSAAGGYLDLVSGPPPSVVSCRGSQINVVPHNQRRADQRRDMVASLEAATLVHCVSEAIMREAQGLGLDPSRARVIRPAVDTRTFQPRQDRHSPGDETVVTHVGSLVWVKGLEYLVHAFALAHAVEPRLRLELVGSGPDRQRVLFTASDLGITQQVVLRGRLPEPEVAALLAQSDIGACSSVSEGISNAVLEAMASGLPVVSTTVGGMTEVLDDGVEGLLVPPRNPHAMAEALVGLARAPEERHRMGDLGRARVLRDHRLEDQAERFHRLFDEAAGR